MNAFNSKDTLQISVVIPDQLFGANTEEVIDFVLVHLFWPFHCVVEPQMSLLDSDHKVVSQFVGE